MDSMGKREMVVVVGTDRRRTKRERRPVVASSHFPCQIHNSVSSRVRFIRSVFCYDGFFSPISSCVCVCPVLSGQKSASVEKGKE